jgi:hypothetical protein
MFRDWSIDTNAAEDRDRCTVAPVPDPAWRYLTV